MDGEGGRQQQDASVQAQGECVGGSQPARRLPPKGPWGHWLLLMAACSQRTHQQVLSLSCKPVTPRTTRRSAHSPCCRLQPPWPARLQAPALPPPQRPPECPGRVAAGRPATGQHHDSNREQFDAKQQLSPLLVRHSCVCCCGLHPPRPGWHLSHPRAPAAARCCRPCCWSLHSAASILGGKTPPDAWWSRY